VGIATFSGHRLGFQVTRNVSPIKHDLRCVVNGL
jgi:hypothetical protein